MTSHRIRYSLIVGLVVFVFLVMFFTTILIGVITVVLVRLNIIPWGGRPNFPFFVIVILLTSTVTGTALAALFARRPLRPIHRLIEATRKIASGDFTVRMSFDGPGELNELVNSFNKMAEELCSIETLRKSFINDFSHEFKTPIVSIRGFAKLLKNDTLTRELREEYIDIIISESERLAELSSKVLVLSKLEHQEILTDRTTFRLDEQIRRTVLIMEPQWRKKNLNLNIELDRVVFNGSEELLHQVWLNLIDNAIKFSDPGGDVSIVLMNMENVVLFRISDNGVGMNEKTRSHLFDRFYKGDESRSSEGTGLGLSLVKRIVELSKGRITVKSLPEEGASFTIELPK